nr:uncharacterized protein LOC133580375 [Nerophis lumbriciformis]
MAVSNSRPAIRHSFETFKTELVRVFDHPVKGKEAASRLLDFSQGDLTVADYSIQFRILAAECGFEEAALCGIFRRGLSSAVKDELAARDDSSNLQELIELSVNLGHRLKERERERAAEHRERRGSTPHSSPTAAGPDGFIKPPLVSTSTRRPVPTGKEPMQLGGGHLSAAERRRLMMAGLCLFCGLPGHRVAACDAAPSHRLESSLPGAPLARGGTSTRFVQDSNPSSELPLDELKEQRDSQEKTATEPAYLKNVPAEYHDLQRVFSKEQAGTLPPHRPYDCAIDLLPNAPLPSSRLYKVSRPEQEAMREYISSSLASGLIRPSSSPLGAGFFFIGKKDGGLRPCIDYRGLNEITVKNKYPLPLLDSAFAPLKSATIFTKLDLRSAYHLVRIREGDEWKTAFKTPLGHFEYLVMPFGLTNAPAVFQSLINDVLRDMLNVFCFVYLDDILIFSRSLQEHRQHVRIVLRRLLENRLFVKAEKCEFHRESMQFLGFVVEKGQLRPDPAKIQAVAEWPTPTSRKQLQRFLGFANFYRRFIRNYSMRAEPLTRLTSNKRPFVWSSVAEAAFVSLKRAFTNSPVLVHADSDLPFVVEVDASSSGVGAILSQRSAVDQRLHPCAFYSRRLSPAEANYDVGNRELLAIVQALQEWRHWLEGTEVPFQIYTDHKNLEYLRAAKRLNSCQARWALFLTRFNFQITYRPGSRNGKPDALSRLHEAAEEGSSEESIVPENLIVGALRWEVERLVEEALRGVRVPGGCPASKLFVPVAQRAGVLKGCSVILTVVDRFSKMAHFVALPKLPSALETADLLVTHVFRAHGIPCDLVSDRGPQFVSQVWGAFCKALGATSSKSSGYHPQSNGQTERPPLFPSQEAEVIVPSVQVHLRRAHRVWRDARAALVRTAARNRQIADRHRRPAPVYRPGQMVWLSTRDLHLAGTSKKLGPRFVGPFAVDAVVNPVTEEASSEDSEQESPQTVC